MTDTFNWVPLVDPQGKTLLRVRKAQFGDGYAQTAADGLNNVVKTWPLTFRGHSAAINPITAFVESHVGVSFFWTPPLGVQGYYQCIEHNLVPHGGDVYTLTLTLNQVFKP
jgi:phage-related protein